MYQAILEYVARNEERYLAAVGIHAGLSLAAVGLGLLLAVPLGVLCVKKARLSLPVLQTFSLLRIVPSLAVLVLVMPVLGTGFTPALLALILLAVPPILINTYLGFTQINPAVMESARAMGMGAARLFWTVELPLALSLIVAGIRTACTEVIASATLAAYTGAGGLGDFIFTGIGMNDIRLLLLGGGTVAVLSVGAEIALSLVGQRVSPDR